MQPEEKTQEVIVDNPVDAPMEASLLRNEGTPIGDSDIVVEQVIDSTPQEENPEE